MTYEPNPILRAARGSSVSTDAYPSTIFHTDADAVAEAQRKEQAADTAKARQAEQERLSQSRFERLTPAEAEAQGRQAVGEPAIGSRLYGKHQYLTRGTGQWRSEQEFQAAAQATGAAAGGGNYAGSIIQDMPQPEQQSPPQNPAYNPTGRRDSILDGRWQEQAREQATADQAKRYYSVGYGKTEIFHEYNPKDEFKALGFIKQGRPEPGMAYRQDILGFTHKVGKISTVLPNQDRRVSVGSAKLSQASEMLQFSPAVFGSMRAPIVKNPFPSSKGASLPGLLTLPNRGVPNTMALYTKGLQPMKAQPQPQIQPRRVMVATKTQTRPVILPGFMELMTRAPPVTKTLSVPTTATLAIAQTGTRLRTQTQTRTRVQTMVRPKTLTQTRTQTFTVPKTITKTLTVPKMRTATQTATGIQTRTQPRVATRTQTQTLPKTRVQTKTQIRVQKQTALKMPKGRIPKILANSLPNIDLKNAKYKRTKFSWRISNRMLSLGDL